MQAGSSVSVLPARLSSCRDPLLTAMALGQFLSGDLNRILTI